MAGIKSTRLPITESDWVHYAKIQGIDNPKSASIHDYILPSGSKVGNVGFALLRIVRKQRRSPFDRKKRSRTNPDSISSKEYYDQAEQDLAHIQPRAKYLNRLENNPYDSLFESRALELGGYHHVLRSQQRTRKSKRPDAHSTPVDFSPMITRAQARAGRPSQAAIDSARLQSFKLHSNLDLFPPLPQPLQTPTRQTRTEVQSSAMDTDDRSGQQTHLTHTTSSESAGEHISPISGEEAEQDGPAPSEQEVVIAGIAITRITTEIFEQFSDVSWVPTQKPFTVKDQKGKSFTAMVDGLVEVTNSTFTGITMEMKKSNRYQDENNAAAFLAQESCEMAAVIHNMPDDRIEKIRTSGRTAK